MPLLLLLACAGPTLTCREPDVLVFPVEGEPDALCDLTFSACEDGDYVTVSCSNDTFEGDYECTWLWQNGTRVRTDTFRSPDFCTLDVVGMVDELVELGGLPLTVE